MLTPGTRVLIVGTVVDVADIANISVETRGHGDSIRTITVHERAIRPYDEAPALVAASPQPLSSITRSGSVATATAAAEHKLVSGNVVSVLGPNEPEYRYTGPVTVTGPTTFSYPVAGIPVTPATGTLVYVQEAPVPAPLAPVVEPPPPAPVADPPRAETRREKAAREQSEQAG